MAKTILIAEDLEDDAVMLKWALDSAGVKNPVSTVGDGEEVLAYLKGQGEYSDRFKYPLPSVLFLDMKMRRVTGLQVLEWLKAQRQFQGLLVIVITGYSELKELALAYQLGAHSFLTKPCRVEDIQNLTKAFGGHWESSPTKVNQS